jgi:hypothetical protein
MTLAPLVTPHIRGVKGKPVEFGSDECSCPGCHQKAQQRHHLWPKSYLRGQPYEWVSVDGVLLANSIGLCITHHSDVTGGPGGHTAKITYDERLQTFDWWVSNDRDEWICWGPLEQEAGLVHPTEASVVREKENLCPSCGKPKTKKPGKPRKTKSWTVKVPDEEAEHGSAVLDEYVDDLSVAMGWGDESKGVRRYHVLVNVLAWVQQMKPDFLSDWEEAMNDSR